MLRSLYFVWNFTKLRPLSCHWCFKLTWNEYETGRRQWGRRNQTGVVLFLWTWAWVSLLLLLTSLGHFEMNGFSVGKYQKFSSSLKEGCAILLSLAFSSRTLCKGCVFSLLARTVSLSSEDAAVHSAFFSEIRSDDEYEDLQRTLLVSLRLVSWTFPWLLVDVVKTASHGQAFASRGSYRCILKG